MSTLRRLTWTTALAVLIVAASAHTGIAWGIPVSTAAEYMAATKVINPDRVITATADITFTAGDIPIPDGVTFDLNGKTITLVSMLKNPTIRRGFALGDGSALINGTTVNGGWVAYRNGGATKPIVMRDIVAKNVESSLIKLGAGNSGITESIIIERVRADLISTPGTIIDIGPGPCRDVVIRDVRTKCVYDPASTSTSADGIGIELAMGNVLIEDVIIDGTLGDAFDVKSHATIRRSWAINASRQTFKIWGRKDKPSVLEGCVAINSGYGAMVNAGNVTIKNCYLEGGWRDNYSIMLGGGKEYIPGLLDHWGNPNDYGCGGVDAVVTNSQFIQRRGVSRLIQAEKADVALNVRAANVKFNNCDFYVPTHPHVFVGPWVQYTDAAKIGRWDPHITNSRYGDVADPVPPSGPVTPPVDPPIVIPPIDPPIIIPPIDPPVVDPPIVDPPVDDPLTELATVVAELKAWKVSAEAKLNELRYKQDRDDNSWAMLLQVLKNREPVQ